jgi:hypothetical protein
MGAIVIHTEGDRYSVIPAANPALAEREEVTVVDHSRDHIFTIFTGLRRHYELSQAGYTAEQIGGLS